MITLNFMGDVMMGELLETYRQGLIATLKKTKTDPFEFVRPVLAEGDLNIINLEAVFSSTSALHKPFDKILISPEKYLDFLVKNEIHVVNTANNHALDHGVKAFERSCDLVRAQGLHIIGYDQGRYFQEEPVVVDVKGTKIGFLGYNISNFPVPDRERIVAGIVTVVQESRASVDKLVVSIHWGEEYTHIPPPYIVGFGRRILAAGCDILHGHHSHQIQGVHNDGRQIFAPSLGNFIFDQLIPENRKTALLQVGIDGSQLSHTYLPYYLSDRFQPIPAPELEGYLGEINGLLAECLADDTGQKFADAIADRVRDGHNKNRVRMRAKMLAHFWDYLPVAREILNFRRSSEKIFSVIDCEESLPS